MAWPFHLIVDDYSGYKELFRQGVVELACFAHARRKFFELHAANGHPVAAEALSRIGELYAIEAAASELAPIARQAQREREAKPRLNALHDWLQQQRCRTADGGALAKAIDYSTKRWGGALSRYVEDGRYPIDNNPVENAIRPICLGEYYPRFAIMEG